MEIKETNELEGRTALVTGASGGLGAAISRSLARNGVHLVLHYNKGERAINELAATLASEGRPASIVQADLTDDASVAHMLDEISRSGKRPDILVNNAGAIDRPSGWLEQSATGIRAALELNFTAHVLLTRHFAQHMIEQKFGRIINVASTYGITGAAPVLAYTCAKSALITLTYALARELGQHGITVNSVAPGNIDTAMTNAAPAPVLEWVRSTTPIGRLGKPDEVADAVLFLTRSPFVTGTVLVVDGGHILNM